MDMTPRQEKILGTIIKEYTQTAKPVSSGLLCEKYNFKVSTATIRNEMLHLEENDFLKQPHTSAGRVPSEKAYRYFVDNLLKTREGLINQEEKKYIQSEIDTSTDNPQFMSQQIAKVISDISDNFVLSGIVNTGEFFKIGFSRLFGMSEFHEYERILRIVSIFDEFENYTDLIFENVLEETPSVAIGNENSIEDIRDEAVITIAYPLPGGYNGATAIVGPLRMQYEKNIALMKYISQFMQKQNF